MQTQRQPRIVERENMDQEHNLQQDFDSRDEEDKSIKNGNDFVNNKNRSQSFCF